MTEPANRLVIVYDNYALKGGLVPAWGFSCLIALPRIQILFDTGGDPSVLVQNMAQLDIDIQRIDAVVLSHAHGDHVGGLSGLLIKRPDLSVYLPESFPQAFKGALRRTGTRLVEISGPQMIHPGIHTTGELGDGLKEQSLVLNTCRGLVVITGCAHPGIVEIVEHAYALFHKKVHLLIGGFHLMGHSSFQLDEIARRLDALQVEKIAPCHCSGDGARAFFKGRYRENYTPCAGGLFLPLPDLEE